MSLISIMGRVLFGPKKAPPATPPTTPDTYQQRRHDAYILLKQGRGNKWRWHIKSRLDDSAVAMCTGSYSHRDACEKSAKQFLASIDASHVHVRR